ncbi:hypothetical protein DFH09DRAFT_495620 [Mycena vulgaris]|nr:hypothetical protein DFH09DRAFT_495620 [Mycena vulgaris]
MRTTTQALEKKLKSSEQELEELRRTLQSTESATLRSQNGYRKEVETLQSRISTLQRELTNMRGEKDKAIESMRVDAEQSQTASTKESQSLREKIKALERQLDELQEQLKNTKSESVRVQEVSDKKVATAADPNCDVYEGERGDATGQGQGSRVDACCRASPRSFPGRNYDASAQHQGARGAHPYVEVGGREQPYSVSRGCAKAREPA